MNDFVGRKATGLPVGGSFVIGCSAVCAPAQNKWDDSLF